MLAVYSVSIFFVDSWPGMAVFAGLFVVALAASGASARSVLSVAVPVYVIAALTVLFNAFQVQDGSVAFTVQGLVRGCYFALRILLLVWMSLILCLTATSAELTRAFASLLSPLRRLRVPVDDIATVFSVTLRFIPLMAQEFFAIRDVQWSRGAPLGDGPLWRRLKAHFVIFIPLFVGMFRRADRLALAMDARCYGLPGVVPTELRPGGVGGRSWAAAIVASAVCVAAAVFL